MNSKSENSSSKGSSRNDSAIRKPYSGLNPSDVATAKQSNYNTVQNFYQKEETIDQLLNFEKSNPRPSKKNFVINFDNLDVANERRTRQAYVPFKKEPKRYQVNRTAEKISVSHHQTEYDDRADHRDQRKIFEKPKAKVEPKRYYSQDR